VREALAGWLVPLGFAGIFIPLLGVRMPLRLSPLNGSAWDVSELRCHSGEVLVGLGHQDCLVRDQAEAPDRVPRQAMLTAIVQDACIAKLDRQRDGVTKGVVANDDGVVVQCARRPASGVVVGDLRRLDKDNVVQAANLTQHEVTGSCVLGDLDELRVITELTRLVGVKEADIRLAQAGNVLGSQRLDGILYDCRGEAVVTVVQVVARVAVTLQGWRSVVIRRQGRAHAGGQRELVIAVQLGAGLQKGVTSGPVQVQGHVTAEETGA
jgi:hypothetical protein